MVLYLVLCFVSLLWNMNFDMCTYISSSLQWSRSISVVRSIISLPGEYTPEDPRGQKGSYLTSILIEACRTVFLKDRVRIQQWIIKKIKWQQWPILIILSVHHTHFLSEMNTTYHYQCFHFTGKRNSSAWKTHGLSLYCIMQFLSSSIVIKQPYQWEQEKSVFHSSLDGSVLLIQCD